MTERALTAAIIVGLILLALAVPASKPAPKPVVTKPSAPATKSYTQSDIDWRDQRITTLTTKYDEMHARVLTLQAESEELAGQLIQAKLAAQSRPTATCNGSVKKTSARAYTVRRGLFGRTVYVPAR